MNSVSKSKIKKDEKFINLKINNQKNLNKDQQENKPQMKNLIRK